MKNRILTFQTIESISFLFSASDNLRGITKEFEWQPTNFYPRLFQFEAEMRKNRL